MPANGIRKTLIWPLRFAHNQKQKTKKPKQTINREITNGHFCAMTNYLAAIDRHRLIYIASRATATNTFHKLTKCLETRDSFHSRWLWMCVTRRHQKSMLPIFPTFIFFSLVRANGPQRIQRNGVKTKKKQKRTENENMGDSLHCRAISIATSAHACLNPSLSGTYSAIFVALLSDFTLSFRPKTF